MGLEKTERKVTVILAGDLVNYTSMMEKDEETTIAKEVKET